MSIEFEVFSTKDLTEDDIVLVYISVPHNAPSEIIQRHIEHQHLSLTCKALRIRGIPYQLIPKYLYDEKKYTEKGVEIEVEKSTNNYPDFDDSMKALDGE